MRTPPGNHARGKIGTTRRTPEQIDDADEPGTTVNDRAGMEMFCEKEGA